MARERKPLRDSVPQEEAGVPILPGMRAIRQEPRISGRKPGSAENGLIMPRKPQYVQMMRMASRWKPPNG